MACIFEDQCDGRCLLGLDNDGMFDKNNAPEGCDDDGECAVSDDPNPADGCSGYESDHLCTGCDVDLNIDECECDDE